MSSAVTPQFLLQGAAYALEQCGLLLRDANVMYRVGSYASAVVLTAFAREELGRSIMLLDLRREVISGSIFTAEKVKNRCDNHVAKQKSGTLSFVLSADSDSNLGTFLQTIIESDAESSARQEDAAKLAQILEKYNKRIPGDRHQKRMSALYVEPTSELGWNRPTENISASAAHQFLEQAVNDYAGQYNGYQRGYEDAALEQWSDRPKLQAPEWPPFVHL